MIGFLLFDAALVVFVVVVVGAFVFLARRSSRQIDAGPVRDLLRSARMRALTAVGVACAAALVLLVAASALPHLVGLPYLLIPGIAGILGLVAYAARPPHIPDPGTGASRVASLTRRTPVSFVSRGAWAALVLAVVAQVGVVFTGVTGSADERGRLREISFRVGNLGSTAGPYGGWFYAGPLLALDVVFLLILVLALRRIATRPAIGLARYAEIDVAWRRASCRIVVGLAVGTLLPGGALTLASGNAMANASIPGLAPWVAVASKILLVGGMLAVLASVVAFAVTVSWALALPRVVASEAGPPAAPAGPAVGAGERR